MDFGELLEDSNKKLGMRDKQRYVAENPGELVWLRLNRLKSIKICESILERKNQNLENSRRLSPEVIRKKALGLSSAMESAIGYWKVQTDTLNAKVLSRYYAMLQMTIAEQVGAVTNEDDLSRIQKHTEYGHGLGSIRNQMATFPFNEFVFVMHSGHFNSYLKHLGIDPRGFQMNKRPKSFEQAEENNLISLGDLFRRVPELQPVVNEYLNKPPLSFHIGHSDKNDRIDIEKRKEQGFSFALNEGISEQIDPSLPITTYIAIHTDGTDINTDYLNSLNLPIKNIVVDKSLYGETQKVGELIHPNEGYWWNHLNTYKSSYCGTSIVAPLFEQIDDPVVINFMLLYGLSIIVRYMPDLWYEIQNGEMDHLSSLIEYYLTIIDHVLPLQMLNRITGEKFSVATPDSLSGLV